MSLLQSFRVPSKKWAMDLYNEINDDNIFNGGAALAYYLLLALFPALIFFLSVLPYLPIENLHGAVMDLFRQVLPGQASELIEGVVAEVTLEKSGGLLSFGAIATLWAASSGVYAIMQELNVTYDVKESRPFWKARLIAIGLTLLFGLLIITAFSLIVFGGVLQEWLGDFYGFGSALLVFFAAFRWVVIATLVLLAFSFMYYFGPDVKQDFKFITPGAVVGLVVFALASIGLRVYVENFGDYAATYGSIGAVIILMLWLYVAGIIILFGSEINALAEHYNPEGKQKGEKVPDEIPSNALGHKAWLWQKEDAAPSALDAPSSPGKDTGKAKGRSELAGVATRSKDSENHAPDSKRWRQTADVLLAFGALLITLRRGKGQV